MADEFEVDDISTMQSFHTYMGTVSAEYDAVMAYVASEVCNASGFTGLLEPLQQVMGWISANMQTVTDGTTQRWDALAGSVWDAAATYDAQDGTTSDYFTKVVPKSSGATRAI